MRTIARQSEMQRATDAFRQRVLAMEQQATLILSASYQNALIELEPRIIALSKQIEEARANGEEPGISWLFQQERYQELRRQLLTLIDQYGQMTKVVTTEAQKLAVREGLTYAGNVLLPVSGGDGSELATMVAQWASVPDSSVIELVGAMQADTPLDQTIQSYGKDAASAVKDSLTRSLALGDSATVTARGISRAIGITRARAEVLVRTEVLRAARAANIAAYQQSGVVRGWRWSSAKSNRTCIACLLLDGKIFKLTEPMRAHPACRCSAVPVLLNESDRPWFQTGEQWFREQPAKTQRFILNQNGYDAWQADDVELDDFVTIHRSKAWGDSYHQASVADAIRAARSNRRAVA